MNNLFWKSSSLVLAASLILITSCSSGGGGTAPITYSGSTTPAAIDGTNAEAIGATAGEAIQIADSSTGLPAGITSDNSTPIDMTSINNLVISLANNHNLPAGIDVSAETCSSGSASVTDPGNVQSGPVTITITFSNCVLIDNFSTSATTVSGTVTLHYDDIADFDSGFTITYTNFTVIDETGTHTINMTMVCDSLGCTFNSDFVGSDGATHRVTNFTIFGDATSGFSGSATFFHSEHGEVSISFTGITYSDSCGSTPNGGDISFSSSNGSSGTITFSSDCTVSGTWNDGIGGSDTF